jgi:hypothetical protein
VPSTVPTLPGKSTPGRVGNLGKESPVKFAFGVMFIWLGCALLFIATHSLQATTPWQAFQTVLNKAVPAGG